MGSVPSSLDDHAFDGVFTQRPAGLQPVKALHEDVTITIRTNENWRQLALFQHALGDVCDYRLIERFLAFDRHIDLVDGNHQFLHDAPSVASVRSG